MLGVYYINASDLLLLTYPFPNPIELTPEQSFAIDPNRLRTNVLNPQRFSIHVAVHNFHFNTTVGGMRKSRIGSPVKKLFKFGFPKIKRHHIFGVRAS